VPTLNGTVATNIASMVGGPTINPAQVALVRGRVLALPEATPLAGATVSILGHPEYTPSVTGADGTYAVAVNGGGQLTVAFAGPTGETSYLPVQRHTPTRWQQYAVMPDVYLTPLDANATDITLGKSSWQSASGSTITDPADQNGVAGGPRVSPTAAHTARLFFPADTTASFAYGACGAAAACGSAGTCSQGTCTAGECTAQAPASLTVRLTEYTVGATGVAAMPAELPASTGYTYAVELSSDEALGAGATSVSFNQPVSFYVDDFLGFGPAQAGSANPPVPVGYYNRVTGTWIGAPDGAILQITGFSGACPGTGCVATVGEPAGDAGTVVALSADELAFLGQTYGGTATPFYLWRFTTTHFTGWDANWPFEAPPGGPAPPSDGPGPGPDDGPEGPFGCPGGGGDDGDDSDDSDDSDDLSGGSIIQCKNAILAQQIAIPGTPYYLRYQSERAPGRVPYIQIPLTGPTWPPATMPLQVTVEISIEGQNTTLTYDPTTLTANQIATWAWDQKDAFGNTVQGQQLAQVVVSYVYQAVYLGRAAFVASEGMPEIQYETFAPSGSAILQVPNRALNQISLSTVTDMQIGVHDTAPLGLGGWTISAQHVYDPNSYMFFGGNGSRRTLEPGTSILQTVPGISQQQGIVPAVAPNGTIYETEGTMLAEIDPSGNPTVITGAGSVLGPYAACTPAASAELGYSIQSVSVSSSGLIYEASGTVINVIDPVAGTIQTVAGEMDHATGNGIAGCTDAAIATQGTFGSELFGLASAPDGSIYISDETCQSIRRIGTDGSLKTVTEPYTFAPGGCSARSTAWTSGQLASTACLGYPSAVAVAPDGTIYVAEYSFEPEIARIDAETGVITTYAGTLSYLNGGHPLLPPSSYDGQPATSIEFSGEPQGLAVGPDGTVYVSDTGAAAVYAIDVFGFIHLIAGGAASFVEEPEIENAAAVGALVTQPGAIAVSPSGAVLFYDAGNLLLSDNPNSRIRSVVPAFPSFTSGTSVVPSANGRELYEFQPYGQHVATVDPVTGATLRTFQYDALNRLTSIIETRGGTTTIAYNGTSVAITPPFSQGGQQTTLTLDAAGGHALAITSPAGETTQATYVNGLMTTLTDPRSGLHQYAYDAFGHLAADTDPVSATIGVAMTVDTAPVPPDGGLLPLESWTTDITSAAGHVTQHQDFLLSNRSRQRNIIAPSGAAFLTTESSGEVWTTTAHDGTTTSTQMAPDPQFGMLDAYPGTTTRTTPSGLTYASSRTRTATGSVLAPTQIVDKTTINGQSAPWSSTFTAATKQWLSVSPAGRQTLQQLDGLGRVTSISHPGTSTRPTMSLAYDADGRIQSVTLAPNGNGGGPARVTSNTYDTYLAGYLATTADPAGDVTTYDQRDLDGRVLDVELPDFAAVPASHVATTYDPNGNVTSVTVPPATSLSSTHTFTSNPVDLPASYTPPQVSATTSGDDPELATLTTSYTYNPDRRPTTTDVPEGTSYDAKTKTYDAFGRLESRYDPLSNVTATYAYLVNGSGVSTDQIASIATSDGITVSNTFDGFLKTRTAWSSSTVAGSVNWTYDDFFRPATLQVSTAPAITFVYDLDSLYVGTSSPAFSVTRDVTGSSLDGLPYASTLGTVSDAWTYDGFGAQSSYTVKTSDGTVLYAMSGPGGDGTPIARDALGRITSMIETSNGATHSWAYTYDARRRLESVSEDGTTTTYGYDPNGNLTSVNAAPFGTYDAQDRMVMFNSPTSGTWALDYTNNGDLALKASGTQEYAFDYDLSSNLRSVAVSTSTSASIQYVIDGSNRRIGKNITPTIGSSVADGLLYDEQGRVVGELDGSNNVLSTFVYGLKPNVPDYMVRGGVAYRIVSDWRGDVRLVLDTTKTGAAAVVQQVDYDAWGNITNLVDPDCTVGGTTLCFQPFGFAGGIWEPSTGLVRFGARDYDPQTARWAQKDPIRMAGGIDLYVYAGDDPINHSDPRGTGEGWDTCVALQGATEVACLAVAIDPEICAPLALAYFWFCVGSPNLGPCN
jgi:RHS repeat-associated protein